MMTGTVDTALWRVAPRFGVAGGPMAHELTEEGLARAFAVGAKVREGDASRALEALARAGGKDPLVRWRLGSRAELTELGMTHAAAWARLRSLGYVESFGRDGVQLTEAGRVAVEEGRAEQARLLERVQAAHPIEDAS